MFRPFMIFAVGLVLATNYATLSPSKIPHVGSISPVPSVAQIVPAIAAQNVDKTSADSSPCVAFVDAQRFKETLALHGAFTSEISDRGQIDRILNRIHAMGGLTPQPETVQRMLVYIGKRNALFAYVQNNEICAANLGPAKSSLLLLYSVIGETV